MPYSAIQSSMTLHFYKKATPLRCCQAGVGLKYAPIGVFVASLIRRPPFRVEADRVNRLDASGLWDFFSCARRVLRSCVRPYKLSSE